MLIKMRNAYLGGEHGKGHDADGGEDIFTDKVIRPLVFGGIVHASNSDGKQDWGKGHDRDHRYLCQRSDRSVK